MQMLKISIVGVAVGVVAFASASMIQRQTSASDYSQDAVSARAQFVRSQVGVNARLRAVEYGLESSSAGLHVYAPSLGSDVQGLSSLVRTPNHTFFGIGTSLTTRDVTPGFPVGGIPIPLLTAEVSVSPLVNAAHLKGKVSIVGSLEYPGRYALEWSGSESANKALRTAYGPISAQVAFNDWVGREIYPGQSATPMYAILVADHYAHGFFNLMQVLNGPPGPFVALIADNLEFDLASKIIANLD